MVASISMKNVLPGVKPIPSAYEFLAVARK